MKFQISGYRFQIAVALAAFALAVASATAQDNATKPLDETLDLYVRDGFVYYRALRSDRSRLDRYVNAIAPTDVAGRPRDEQIAFWINAYNAIALKTVVDQYPIPQRSKEYPARSIRQVPGAFERNTHRVGGKSVTLDQIEQTILAEFGDPRVFLALGRGARAAVDRGRQRMRDAGPVRRHQQVGQRGPRQLDFLVAAKRVLSRLRG